MANFLYNGVELPNIDAVWTDKTAYPYAIITSFDAALVGYSGSSTIYLLDASGVAHYNNNGVCYKNPPYLSCSWFCSYDPDVCSYLSGMGLPITVGEWGGSSPSDIGSGSAQSVVGTVFWSNADILNTDGSVHLAASTPIRVGSKLNISIAVNHETDLYFYGQSDTMHKLPMDDAATLPYVTILEPKGMHGTYYAYFTAVQFTGKTGRIWLETESNYAEWYYSDGTWNRTATGHFAANTGFTLNSGSGQVYNRVWHNYDMMTEKGELAWKVGVFVREYVYNGITVPNSLPAHDAAMYPYEILTTSAGTIPNHYYVTDTKAMTDESGNVIIPSNTKYRIYTFDLNAFCFDSGTTITATEAVTISDSSEILAWTNHDVLNTDGTVFFAAPDLKVPSGLTWNAVDGYLDTGTFMEMPCYKMFNEIPIYDDLLQGTLSIGAGGHQVSMPLSEEGMLFEEEGLLVIAETLFVVPNEVAPSMGLPSGGVWAVGDLSAAGIESLTLDYPNAPSAGSAGLTNTTALVYFNCNDLNSTEPIDSIHAWVYKKSDGLNTTIPPTWTSEMFAAPSYSTSHTFTGLTPNTEYEVYGCIFVNGEATDHNAIAAFTTLDGEGEEEPVITETSGDGFALYNGVKLPNIDSVWTDRVKHPYAIVSFTMGVGQVSLLPEAFSYDGNTIRYTDMASYVYDPTGVSGEVISEWMLVGGADSGTLNPSLVVWASYDIPNTANSSTFLSASEPIPLDGMTVIEWNGGTAGLTNSGTGLYKITDDVFASNQVIGGVFVQNVSSKLTAIPITTVKVSAYENGISIDGKIYTSPANTLMPESGTYFVKLVSDYVSLFAYPTSGGGDTTDLKPVYKRVSGTWVKQTAYNMLSGEWVLISTS